MIGDPWEGHEAGVWCLDWSPDALEIASGSEDGTIRCWNPDHPGRQIAPPIKTSHAWVNAVKYSPQGDKFISGGNDAIYTHQLRAGRGHGTISVVSTGHKSRTRTNLERDVAAAPSASGKQVKIREYALAENMTQP
jgi:WD40 repeat protein